MITTVKIQSRTKHLLDDLKSEHQTYDQVIATLAQEAKKKHLVKEMVEGYKVRAKEDKKIAEDWDSTSSDGL